MKRLLLFLIIFASPNVMAERAKKEVGPEPEMIQGTPKRPHSILSPISSDKTTQEKAFKDLKKKAQEMGADAIINWKCETGESARGGGILGIGHKIVINSSCEGMAVRWL